MGAAAAASGDCSSEMAPHSGALAGASQTTAAAAEVAEGCMQGVQTARAPAAALSRPDEQKSFWGNEERFSG
jgi:hypothetical protein